MTNKVLLTGRLVRDTEVKEVKEGLLLGTLTVAVGEKKDVAFVDCKGWNDAAKAMNGFMKGALVTINGKLKTESWDDKTTGQKRSKLVVIIEAITGRAD